MPLSTANFAGLPIREAKLALARGVAPSRFVVYLPAQAGILDATGTLSFGDGGVVRLTGCAVAAVFVRHNRDRKWATWAVHGYDRRWQWAGKTVSGDYNRRAADGTVDQSTQKTPSQLANLLLQALGESGFDTSQMPSNVRPRALWNNIRADLALQSLCDYVACEVVLNPLSDRVEIHPLGVGTTALTGDGEMRPKYTYAPRATVPSRIKVLCGPSVYQSKLQLKCVLRDYSTGRQQLRDNWEGKPSDWSVESPASLPGISSTNNRAIAYAALYREFRVQGQHDGSLAVPNCPVPISSTDQYLLRDYLLETETDLAQFKRNLPAYLSGDYYAWTDLPNNTSDARYSGEFHLDPERRIVKLPYPLFKLSSSGAYEEPDLYLTTSYLVRSTTGQAAAIERTATVGGSGGELVLRRPEVFATYSTSTDPTAKPNTESQAIAEADAYLALFQRKFNSPFAAEITYPGIRPFSPDGNIAQVAWQWSVVSPEDNRTTVYEREEGELSALGPGERRRRLDLARLVEASV